MLVNSAKIDGVTVPLSEQLLQKIVCPECKGKLRYDKQKEQLICENCRVKYRVTDDIPVLLADEAEKLQDQ